MHLFNRLKSVLLESAISVFFILLLLTGACVVSIEGSSEDELNDTELYGKDGMNCGNNVCSGKETCSTCPADCGACDGFEPDGGSISTPDAGSISEPSPDAAPDPDPDPAPVSGGPFLPYDESSFFRSSLPNDAPIDPSSAEGIAFVKNHPDQNGTDYPVIRGLGTNKWGTVYFEGNCSDPLWTLTGQVPAAAGFLKTQGFHAPAALGDSFTGTSDSPFVVLDRCGVPEMPEGLSVWAANAAKGTGYTIQVSTAGAYEHDSNGLDKRNPQSNSNKNFRSRGAIPDSMVIRRDRLDWAIANDTGLGYVLHMFWVETRTADGVVHPMIGEEGDKFGWGPEGIRIRVKPTVDLSTRGLSPGGLAVARTLQSHGAYLGDNSGSKTALKAEQNIGQWGNLLDAHALSGLTWDDFEFVERGYQP